MTCTTATCRIPPRSRDLVGLRAFAAQHAAVHAGVAAALAHAWRHCGSTRCAAHPDAPAHCAGGVVLVLQHGPLAGRVWTLEEVCRACAPLIPHARVLARAAGSSREKPEQGLTVPAPLPAPFARPGIPGGFSSPAV
ncbi:hypothetical protein ACWC6I_10580 [Streptomyces sp. NPDC001414]